MSSAPINLDALAQQNGAVGATPAPQPGGGVNLDALAQLSGAVGATPLPPPQHWYDTATNELSDLASGFKTGLNQTGETAMRVAGATGIPQRINPQGWQQSQQQTQQIANAPLDTPGKKAGNLIENIIEYAAGDEALKGASTLAKIDQLAPVAAALKKSPILTRIVGNALRAQTVGTAQALGKGQSLPDAATTGAVNALTSGALEGGGEYAKMALTDLVGGAEAAMPDTVSAFGHDIPRFAAQREGTSPLTGEVITPANSPEIGKAQQSQAKAAFGSMATRAAQRALDRFGAVAEPADDLGQAAGQLKNKASALYDEFNNATEGRFRKINDKIQDLKDSVFGDGSADFKAQAREDLDTANKELDQLFDGFDNANYSEALRSTAAKAKDTFADHYIMDSLHRPLNKIFDIASEQTANEADGAARSINVPGQRRGDMGKILADLEDKYGRPKLDSVLGADAWPGLTKIARVTDNPALNAKAQSIVEEMGKVAGKATGGAATGGLISHFTPLGWGPGAAIGGAIGGGRAAANLAARKTMYAIATSPRLTNMLHYAASNAITPTYAARLLAIAKEQEDMRQSMSPQQPQETQ